jgi:hypothetical protein
MSFRSKKVGSLRLRDSEMETDALFESDWDELVIRFDPESRSYRVMRESDPEENKRTPDLAKVASADV